MSHSPSDTQVEFGCEHLATLIEEGNLSTSSFPDRLRKTAARIPDEASVDLNGRDSQYNAFSFTAKYHCIQCREAGTEAFINKHGKKTGHHFALDQRTLTLYCNQCKDLIYDPTAERLRMNSWKVVETSPKKRKMSEVNGDDSYLTTNSSQRPCGRDGVRGLFNLGETCYMNAILQMMVHNQLLSSYFLSNQHPVHACADSCAADAKANGNSEDSEEESSEAKIAHQPCVSCGVSKVFAESKMSEKSEPMEAVNLLFASWKAIPHMAGKSQQDAQEYYMMLVDKLHESISVTPDSKARCHCFFHQAFFGRLRSEVTCDGCGAVSRTQDPFSAISLDFQKQVKKKKKAAAATTTTGSSFTANHTNNANSSQTSNATATSTTAAATSAAAAAVVPDLHTALQNYTSPEALSAEDYTCRECGRAASASKRLRIRKLPAILCIQVKRFGGRMAGGSYIEEKHEGKLDFPLAIDMAPYTSSSAAVVRRRRPSESVLSSSPPDAATTKKENLEYDLESVIVHQGQQIQNGHYLAFCRQDDRWYKFDDELVSLSTTDEVLRQEAYLLFYSLRSFGGVAES